MDIRVPLLRKSARLRRRREFPMRHYRKRRGLDEQTQGLVDLAAGLRRPPPRSCRGQTIPVHRSHLRAGASLRKGHQLQKLSSPNLQQLPTMAASGMTMILVTHEIGFAREVADTVVFLDEGRVVEAGPPASVLTRPGHQRARAFLAAVL